MITFGYRNKANGLVRAVTAIAIGVVMIVSGMDAMVVAVRIIAAFLVASGVVSMLVGYKNRQDGALGLMGFNAVVDIVLGLLVFIFPKVVAGLLVYLIGLALLGFGLLQVISLISANRVMPVGPAAFILPVLVAIAGGFLLANPGFIGKSIGIISGVALIIYGLSELLSSWKMRKAIDEYEIRRGPAPADEDVAESEIKDVDYEKVDEQ